MILRTFIMLAVSATFLTAQTESKNIKLRAAALGIVNEQDTLWAGNGPGKEATPIRLNTRTFGPEVEVRSTAGKLVLYLERKDAEAASPPPAAVSVTFAGERGLLIFAPEQERYRAFMMPDDETSAGDFVLFNLAQQPLAWSFDGNQAEVITAGGRAIHHTPGGISTAVKIVMKQPDGSLKVIRNTVWQMGGSQREFVFVYGTPNAPKFHHLIASEPLKPADGTKEPRN
ncbi:MAG: hypothetical protein QM755_01990 [Luteolibacter sp.]